MKILYATDLHGHRKKYELVLDSIWDHEVIILGADILPKHTPDIHEAQKRFIYEFLPDFFEKVETCLIIDLGNDDLMCFYYDFMKVVKNHGHVYSSHGREVIINGVSFLGMHFVPDYPFGLKDWCRRDGTRVMDPIQLGRAIISSDNKFEPLDNLEFYLKNNKSIFEVLNNLPKPMNNKAVYLMHAPPRTIGLDVCIDGRQVGSNDVTEFILMEEPLLTLHGHIHESPDVTGFSMNSLSETISVQPGQSNKENTLVYCEFELDNISGTFQRIKKEK